MAKLSQVGRGSGSDGAEKLMFKQGQGVCWWGGGYTVSNMAHEKLKAMQEVMLNLCFSFCLSS